jgi:hypothetical protein
MGDYEDGLLAAAIQSLSGPIYPISVAANLVPKAPGLYAVHAVPKTWAALGLDLRGTPLYVGKAENSLVSRDLRAHFALDPGSAPTTGSSTLRRSLAALLREPLSLRAVPRNRDRPERFDKFALESEAAELRLTDWMHAHLTLAFWPKPTGLRGKLKGMEARLLDHWDPPINIQGSPTKLPRLVDARTVMREEARDWALENGH